jgi:hypothetical protein
MATGASLPEHRAMPERRTSEGVESTLQVVAAQRVAQATVTGFALCEECGLPLSERQKVAFLTAAVLELDGLHQELTGVLHVERLIADLLGRS